MASRKQISSSFTVSVVEDGVDGASDQQIYKLSSTYPWSGGTPSGGSGDNDVPSGWSRTVLGVSESNKYCYISSRTKSNGTWSAWSTPVLYTKWAADGTSLSIKGTAAAVIPWGGSLPQNPSEGEIYLHNDNAQDDIDIWENGSWEGYSCDIGDGYMLSGDFWQMVNATPTATKPRWKNIGRIQGAKGDDGDSVTNTTVYKPSATQPSTPTDTTALPTGWLATPPSLILNAKPQAISGKNSFSAGEGERYSFGDDEGDYFAVDRLTFTTTEANQVIALEIDASTEYNYDYLYVGNLDAQVPSRPFGTASQAGDKTRVASGDEKKICVTVVASAGSHFLDIIYTKDSSESDDGDIVHYRIITNVWQSSAKLVNNVVSGSWSTPIRWSDGRNPQFTLVPSHESLAFHRSGSSTTPASYQVYCGYKTSINGTEEVFVGSTVANRKNIGAQLMSIYRRRLKNDGTYYSWVSHGADGSYVAVTNTRYGIEFALSTAPDASSVNEGNIVNRVTIPCVYDGAKGDSGEKGSVGRYYYYATEWYDTDNESYVVSDIQAPFFSYNGQYWLYNATQNGTYTMRAMGAPRNSTTQNPTPWELMWNDQKYLITEAVFGQYAHFGAAIINGDYMLSQYGFMRGFNEIHTAINDSTQYQNADPDDMFGESDLYEDQSAFVVNNSSEVEVSNTSSTIIQAISAFTLQGGRWYTIEVDGHCDSGTVTFEVGVSSRKFVTGTINQYTDDNTFFPTYLNFYVDVTTSNCRLYAKKSSSDVVEAVIKGVYLRTAQFVANWVVDLKVGKMVANAIVARGELHAESLYSENVMSSNDDDIVTVRNESIITLGYGARRTKVIIPHPSTANGRTIEIYSGIQDGSYYRLGYDGANASTYFYDPCRNAASTVQYYRQANYQMWNETYVKLWSNGSSWYVLKAEYTLFDNVNKRFTILLATKDYPR